MAEIFEHGDCIGQDQRIVVDGDDHKRLERHGIDFTARPRLRLRLCWGNRQPKFGDGTFAKRAVDDEAATELFGQAVHHGQTETRALAGRLGGEKRFSRAAKGLGVHAGATVGDGKSHITACL